VSYFSLCAGYSCPRHIFLREMYSLIDMAKQHDANGTLLTTFLFHHRLNSQSIDLHTNFVDKAIGLMENQSRKANPTNSIPPFGRRLNDIKEIKSSLEARYRIRVNKDVSNANGKQKNEDIRTKKRQ